jgi:hypothetical protein
VHRPSLSTFLEAKLRSSPSRRFAFPRLLLRVGRPKATHTYRAWRARRGRRCRSTGRGRLDRWEESREGRSCEARGLGAREKAGQEGELGRGMA